jgi:hypothetical protein
MQKHDFTHYCHHKSQISNADEPHPTPARAMISTQDTRKFVYPDWIIVIVMDNISVMIRCCLTCGQMGVAKP